MKLVHRTADSLCMKRIAFLLLVVIFAANAIFSETTTIRFENDTDSLVYFVAVEPGNGLSVNGPTASATVAALKAVQTKLEYLAPRTVAAQLSVPDRETLLIGFAVESGASTYPLWYVRIPAKSKRAANAWYPVSKSVSIVGTDKNQAFIRPLDLDFSQASIRIDGRFVDWLKFSDLLAWPTRSFPIRTTRNSGSGVAAIENTDSMFFKRAGTDIEHLRVLRNKHQLYIMVSSHSVLTKGLSYIFRTYAPGNAGNIATFEIPVEAASGPVLIWEQGNAKPVVAGDFAANDYYIEARFNIDSLPASCKKLFESGWKFELASSFTDGEMTEEFAWGSFPTSGIPQTE